MVGTMKGILKTTTGVGAEYRTDLPIPQISDNEVLIKVNMAAVCGTDIHIYHWTDWASARIKPPIVIGHEFVGEIVELGSAVTGLAVGDRVSGETHFPCNRCFQCETDNRHLCENVGLLGATRAGCFAEYVKLPQDVAVKLDDDITDAMGAMMEPMGAGVHGIEKAQVKDKTVLISGCGAIGLMSIGAAVVHGAKRIIACDIVEEKLEVAKKMGADVVFNSMEQDITQEALRLTDGRGVDAAIDYSGNGGALVAAIKGIRKGGIMVGVGLPQGEVSLNVAEAIFYKEVVLTGVSGRRMYETWDDCFQILKDKRYKVDLVTGQTFAMSDFVAALEAARSGAPGKMLLVP